MTNEAKAVNGRERASTASWSCGRRSGKNGAMMKRRCMKERSIFGESRSAENRRGRHKEPRGQPNP
eukprot:7713686-Pyramimonas_sp.AAC.1